MAYQKRSYIARQKTLAVNKARAADPTASVTGLCAKHKLALSTYYRFKDKVGTGIGVTRAKPMTRDKSAVHRLAHGLIDSCSALTISNTPSGTVITLPR